MLRSNSLLKRRQRALRYQEVSDEWHPSVCNAGRLALRPQELRCQVVRFRRY